MDIDIQLGEVEETARQRHLRPDRNKHYAVVPYESPGENDLPVFVDLDAFRDMELHALSNTNVELGGVLLGGQHEDENGNPFVLVTDSLRAEHYESTKGSFKFTHDTWSKITRQRDEFPDDMQMVGWYHTHPDWGVFLSGMDMFICDNFFNRPLDLALVIDPCRGDRGWFQWTGDPHDRIRRMGGFYLIASRHRRTELEWFAAQLQGGRTMANDPRFGGMSGMSPAPVVNIAEQRSPWHAVAMMGMLTVQFLFVALIAWRMLTPVPPDTADQKESDEQVTRLLERLDRLTAARAEAANADAQMRVLDRVVTELRDGTPDGIVQALKQQQLENDRIRDDLRIYQEHMKVVESEKDQLGQLLAAATSDKKYLTDRVDTLTEKIAKLEKVEKEQAKLIEKLKDSSQAKRGADSADGDKQTISNTWIWIGGGVLLLTMVVMAVILTYSTREGEPELDEPQADDLGEPNADSEADAIPPTDSEADRTRQQP